MKNLDRRRRKKLFRKRLAISVTFPSTTEAVYDTNGYFIEDIKIVSGCGNKDVEKAINELCDAIYSHSGKVIMERESTGSLSKSPYSGVEFRGEVLSGTRITYIITFKKLSDSVKFRLLL